MSYLYRILPAFVLLITSLVAGAQQSFITKAYTTENGLPSNGIKGLQWDESTGFLWIATEAGIVRFDGTYFKTFTKENTAFISSERISFVTRNHRGNIYFADLPQNIIAVDQNQLRLVQQADKYSVNHGAFLIAVSEFFFSIKKKENISDIFASYNDILSVSDTSALFRYEDELYYYSLSMPKPTLCKKGVTSLFKLLGRIFVTTGEKQIFTVDPAGVPAFTPYDHDIASLLPGASIRYTNGMPYPLLIRDGNVWKLNISGNNKLTATLLLSGIPKDIYIKSVQYSTALNILFVGTDSKGLMIFYPERVTSKRRMGGTQESRNAQYSQVALSNGNVLTNEGDIIGDAAGKVVVPISGKFGYSLYLMNDSILWYHQFHNSNQYSNLTSYNYTTGKTTPYPKIIYADAMFSKGDTLFAVSNTGLGYIDGDSLRIIKAFTPKPGNIYFSSVELSPGVFAVASCDGLLKIDINKKGIDTLLVKGNSCIRSLWKYQDYVFIGTYGAGFYIYRDGKIKHMPLDKNNYLLYTHCFVADDKGFCFMSTNRGLFKASLQQMTRAFDDDNIPVYYYYFGRNDGVQMTELNGGCAPCALKLKNKVISFPTMDGLLWVDPEKATSAMPKGDIMIDDIIIDGNKYAPDSKFLESLPYNTTSIKLNITLSAWCNKENIYLDYELNESGKWIAVNLDNGPAIEFNTLPPGSYSLKVRKLNGFDEDTYIYRTIRFHIDVPWYRTWWCISLAVLAFAGMFYWFYKFRTQQYKLRQKKLEKQVAEKTKALQQQNELLEKNNTIKTRLISIISHDIITPLKFVTVAGKELLEKKEKMPDELRQETIQEITNTSQELQLLSTNILNWIKYQNENRMVAKEHFFLSELVQEVFGVLNSLAKQKKLRLVNDVDAAVQIVQYYEPIKILVYNLIANAIHFTEEGNIIVSSTDERGHTVISVTDKGCGMTDEQINNILADQTIISSANVNNKKGHGLGYLIIKDLVKMMGASLEIESVIHKGTRVSILIPR
jgi:signal transduction histidine kinase